MKYVQIIIALVFTFGIIGCSKDNTITTTETEQPKPFTIAPSDGSSGVRLDASISFSFIKPVDKTITERNIHLIGERAMTDSLCTVNNMMEHGSMAMTMLDSVKMNHIMIQHKTPGTFTWNNDSTECTFRPDSMMVPNMQYMMHVGKEMMQMMSNRMGSNMGTMAGHGTGMMSNDMMYHFRTMDTTQTGGGHEGHH